MMKPEELAHYLEFGDKSKGIQAEWVNAAASALRELAKYRDRSITQVISERPSPVETDRLLSECRP